MPAPKRWTGIIDAYRVFMQEHREIAGLVAEDLAAWQYWGAVPDYVALMKSGVRQQYASRAAIVAYLRQSPGGATNAASPTNPPASKAGNPSKPAP